MQIIDAALFTADQPWGARDLAHLGDATVRLHWTNESYHWHVNDGPEVFVVLDGTVRMHHRTGGVESHEDLRAGLVCIVEVGDEHVAEPLGTARILVIEQAGSE
ncbi:cupin [Nocardioides lijunqiniae]|uniref:cupin n=1 Tax=Nocardioides lijunqiniae TaxID=2760832 RepID=UPI001878D32A|nr:cupin [Nocardioides lijunqiniae]